MITRNIQIKYFSNSFADDIMNFFTVNKKSICFQNIQHLDFSHSKITNDYFEQFVIQNQIRNLKILNLTYCKQLIFNDLNLKY